MDAPSTGAESLADTVRHLEQKLAAQRKVLSAIHAFSGETSLERLLGRIMEEATRAVDADRSSLFLYDRDKDELWSKIAQGLDTTEIRFSARRGIAGEVARSGALLNIPDAYADARFNPDWDRVTGYRTCSVLAMPMRSRRGETIGVLQVLNKAGGNPFTEEDEEALGALATNASSFIENAQLHEQIQALFEAFVRVSMSALDERDPATRGHSDRVAAYTLNLARRVHDDQGPRFGTTLFTREEMREIRFATLLHDYGKIGVREHVLAKANKLSDPEVALICQRLERLELEARLEAALSQQQGEPAGDNALAPWRDTLHAWRETVCKANIPDPLGSAAREALDAMLAKGVLTGDEHGSLSIARGNLTPAEWDDMRSHVTRSYHLLRQIPWPGDLAAIPEIAWCHHERLDGSGYPRKLVGDKIPLVAQIMAVADTFDALTAADRPYKRAMPNERAFDILRMESGEGHLDRDLVEMFIEGRAWDLGARNAGAS